MPKNIKRENTKAKNPYARAKWLALVSMAGLATLLNIALQDWIASLHLAIVVVFTIITLGFAVHTLIIAIANRATGANIFLDNYSRATAKPAPKKGEVPGLLGGWIEAPDNGSKSYWDTPHRVEVTARGD